MATLTAANTVIVFTVNGLFNAPFQLQGFAADDIFSTEPVTSVETLIGVDGILSAGFVPTEKKMNITFQADSPSNVIMEAWQTAQEIAREAFVANGFVTIPSIGRLFTCTQGYLTTYPPTPDVRRILQPRRYGLTWQSIIGAPIPNG